MYSFISTPQHNRKVYCNISRIYTNSQPCKAMTFSNKCSNTSVTQKHNVSPMLEHSSDRPRVSGRTPLLQPRRWRHPDPSVRTARSVESPALPRVRRSGGPPLPLSALQRVCAPGQGETGRGNGENIAHLSVTQLVFLENGVRRVLYKYKSTSRRLIWRFKPMCASFFKAAPNSASFFSV